MNDFLVDEVIEVPSGGKKNVILDATVLTSLMACPRMSDFRFNLNLISIKGKSNSLECGSIVHKFLETYYKLIIQGMRKEQATQFALASAELYIRGCKFCTDFQPIHDYRHETVDYGIPHKCNEYCKVKPSCGHQIDEYPGVHNTPKDSEGYKIGWQYALDTCDQYLTFYKNDHWVPLEVEVVKGEVLYEDDEIRVLWKSKLDWIVDTNQGIYPVDHKTMKQRRNTISLNNQFIGQCLIMRTRNVFINKIGFQTTLKPEEKFTRPPVSYSAARLLEWQSETLPYYAKLLLMYAETNHFPPNFTNCEHKYGECNYKTVCESDPGMRAEELRNNFKVGRIWNPTNEDEGD